MAFSKFQKDTNPRCDMFHMHSQKSDILPLRTNMCHAHHCMDMHSNFRQIYTHKELRRHNPYHPNHRRKGTWSYRPLPVRPKSLFENFSFSYYLTILPHQSPRMQQFYIKEASKKRRTCLIRLKSGSGKDLHSDEW